MLFDDKDDRSDNSLSNMLLLVLVGNNSLFVVVLGYLELSSLSVIPPNLNMYKNQLRLDPMVVFGKTNDMAFYYDKDFNLKNSMFISTIKHFMDNKKRAPGCQTFGTNYGTDFPGMLVKDVHGFSRLELWLKKKNVIIVAGNSDNKHEYCLDLYEHHVHNGIAASSDFFEEVLHFIESF